jgi:hypothetical protein
MGTNAPAGTSQRLRHRGVAFSLRREGGEGYRWTVHLASGSPEAPLNGVLVGLSAFRRAHAAALAAIDLWLKHHPEDGGEA